MRRRPLAAVILAALAVSCAGTRVSTSADAAADVAVADARDPGAAPDEATDPGNADDDAAHDDATDPGPPPDVPDPADLPSDLPAPPPSCCRGPGDCGPDEVCAQASGSGHSGFGVCANRPEDGRCWTSADCGLGQGCLGAGLCPCQADCDMEYAGTGVCAPLAGPGGACATVNPDWVAEVCDAASVVVFDGVSCVATCPGCCGCEPFCSLTFPTIGECEARCVTPPASCPPWLGALAEGPFTYLWDDAPPGACARIAPRDEPCRNDAECPAIAPGGRAGSRCLFGSCVECVDSSGCGGPAVCVMGRCIDPAGAECPPPIHGTPGAGCANVGLGEPLCAAYICDTFFGHSCSEVPDCLALDDKPYQACGLARCSLCLTDEQCLPGSRCMTPGICLPAEPNASRLYGAWLLEVGGSPTRAVYLRFEFDGGLRRARFEPSGDFVADLPPLPCVDPTPVWPQRGTWEPVSSAGGVLTIQVALNLYCDLRDGFRGRWDVTFPTGAGGAATFRDTGTGLEYTGRKVPARLCQPDFADCPSPGG
jgi:hypothetical protein